MPEKKNAGKDTRGSVYSTAAGAQRLCYNENGEVPPQEDIRQVIRAVSRYILLEAASGAIKIPIPNIGTIKVSPTREMMVYDLEKNDGSKKKVGGNKAKISFAPSGFLREAVNAGLKKIKEQEKLAKASPESMPEEPTTTDTVKPTPTPSMPKATKDEGILSIFDELGLDRGVEIEEA